jgi:exodeoxyribonuclease V alpha subunit
VKRDPARQASELAEAFARHIAAWARAQQAPEAAVQAAAQAARDTSLATSAGHVCLALGSRAGAHDLGALRALLLASGVVGTPQQPGAMPLVLDDGARLYLHRYFDLERRLARRLLAAASSPMSAPMSALMSAHMSAPRPAPDRASAELLATLFGDAPDATVTQQRAAVAMALGGRLTVIGGGPGTGKTTTVVNLLACLLAQDPHARIALAAPTGKAAARMSQALRERSAHLPAALRARLPVDASTVHRLLGATPDGSFTHHAGNRLALTALVVDEASMLDLALATRLLEAVPDDARIVLLGDKDQLAAVESGSVFADLSAQARPGQAPHSLAGRVVWLEHNFRFAADSGVGQLAGHIRAGRADEALATLRGGGQATLCWLDGATTTPWPALQAGLAPYLDAVAAGCITDVNDTTDSANFANFADIHQAWAGFRVLCAVHDGPQGVLAVNAALTAHARARLGRLDAAPLSPWYAGRPVMMLRNDAGLRLFNGDIGLTLPDPAADGALRVFFPAPHGPWRALAPARLPEHQTAYAMTVHKAQGSEFDQALLLLPAQGSQVLTRELLYTAVTRVRQGLTVWATAPVLVASIAQPTQRQSGLPARLLEALE